MKHEIKYSVISNSNTITLNQIYPESDYVESLFYNESLFNSIDLDNDGDFRLTVDITDDGDFNINGLEGYTNVVLICKGWIEE